MDLWKLLNKLKKLSDFFYANGIVDIYTNSKIYEVLIANILGHQIINGHAYSPDAKDEDGNCYEYKHYKKSSSNHTWTFNDYSTLTIERLYYIKAVYFVVINDKYIIPEIEQIYIVPGGAVAEYIKAKILNIENHRKMINIGFNQIIDQMPYELIDEHEIKMLNSENLWNGSIYHTTINAALNEIFITVGEIEKIIKVRGILTSNKLWELLLACKLKHKINPEQKMHDAYDIKGRTYEYKISIKPLWTFQDISDNVLESYLSDEKIILAIVDKRAFIVQHIAVCKPKAIIEILNRKLSDKKERFSEIRRLTASIGMKDINQMIEMGDAEWIL